MRGVGCLLILMLALGCSAEAEHPCDGCFHATCETSDQCPPGCWCDPDEDDRCVAEK